MKSIHLNKRLTSYSLAVLCLLLSSCSTKNPLESDQNAEIAIEIIFPSHNSLKKTSSAATISRVIVTVTASDMDTIQAELIISDNKFSGDIEVKQGEDRIFAVEAKDGKGLVQYSGSTKIDILEDTTVPIELQAHTPESVFLMKRDATYNSATLYWKKNTDPDFFSYKLNRSQSPGVSTTSELIHETTNNIDTTYTDQELLPSTNYYYKVFVFDTENLFTGSNEVMITSSEPPATIFRSPSSMQFTATEGGSPPSNQTLQISNSGGGTLNWSVSDDAPWLSLSPTNGTSTGETDNVTVSVDITGLQAGTHNATITITGSGATNTPQTTSVTLTLAEPPPTISRSPGSMSFSATEGGGNPANQTLQISNSGGGTLNWNVGDNQSWLSLSPTSGSSTGETDNVTVSVDISNLPAGTYNAIIIISDPNANNSPQTVAVTLNLNAG